MTVSQWMADHGSSFAGRTSQIHTGLSDGAACRTATGVFLRFGDEAVIFGLINVASMNVKAQSDYYLLALGHYAVARHSLIHLILLSDTWLF